MSQMYFATSRVNSSVKTVDKLILLCLFIFCFQRNETANGVMYRLWQGGGGTPFMVQLPHFTDHPPGSLHLSANSPLHSVLLHGSVYATIHPSIGLKG